MNFYPDGISNGIMLPHKRWCIFMSNSHALSLAKIVSGRVSLIWLWRESGRSTILRASCNSYGTNWSTEMNSSKLFPIVGLTLRYVKIVLIRNTPCRSWLISKLWTVNISAIWRAFAMGIPSCTSTYSSWQKSSGGTEIKKKIL